MKTIVQILCVIKIILLQLCQIICFSGRSTLLKRLFQSHHIFCISFFKWWRLNFVMDCGSLFWLAPNILHATLFSNNYFSLSIRIYFKNVTFLLCLSIRFQMEIWFCRFYFLCVWKPHKKVIIGANLAQNLICIF